MSRKYKDLKEDNPKDLDLIVRARAVALNSLLNGEPQGIITALQKTMDEVSNEKIEKPNKSAVRPPEGIKKREDAYQSFLEGMLDVLVANPKDLPALEKGEKGNSKHLSDQRAALRGVRGAMASSWARGTDEQVKTIVENAIKTDKPPVLSKNVKEYPKLHEALKHYVIQKSCGKDVECTRDKYGWREEEAIWGLRKDDTIFPDDGRSTTHNSMKR